MYLFIISIVSKRYYILYFTPLIMVLGFFSKQTPVAYGIFGIIFIVCLLFFIDKKECFQLFRYLIFGSAGAIIFIFIFFAITKINFQNFYTQYILFSQTIGKFRLSQYQFEFFPIINQFKFIIFYLTISAVSMPAVYSIEIIQFIEIFILHRQNYFVHFL